MTPTKFKTKWARFSGKDEHGAATSDLSGIRYPLSGIGLVRCPLTEPRDAECAAKLANLALTNLYNERPAWLANAHAKLDAAAAYGWPANLSDDEILSRLLALNQARSAAEQAAAKKSTAKPRAAREKSEDEML